VKRVKTILRYIVLMILLWVMTGLPAGAADRMPGAKDKCPVCGMFVAKFPDWTAAVRFKDGTTAWFDGCKDLFTYYLNVRKYSPARTPDTITAIQVKDYYALRQIDGRKAFYVAGSDVFGPMGKELIPFEKAADAGEFLRDHNGKRVVKFSDITPALLKTLE